MNGAVLQLALPLGPVASARPPRRGRAATSVAPAASTTPAAEPLQVALPLAPGPAAATPPFCPCCQTRGCIPMAGGGWTTCTWCEGSRVDPVATAARPPAWTSRRGVAVLGRLAS